MAFNFTVEAVSIELDISNLDFQFQGAFLSAHAFAYKTAYNTQNK